MANYDLDYALEHLRQAIDYAEIEGDFWPARRWMIEVEKSIEECMKDCMQSNPTLPNEFIQDEKKAKK